MLSSKMKLLVTGSGGLLGRRVVAALQKRFDFFGGRIVLHYHSRPDGGLPKAAVFGDLGDKNHIADLARPDIIINCAALADVDHCEGDEALSERTNVGAVRLLLGAFPGALFVQISTDYVFPDSPTAPLPDTPTAPLNIYGRHKLAAEKAVLEHSQRNLVIRTNTMYDYEPRRNFFRFVYESLKNEESIRCFIDQFSNPLSATSAADLVVELIAGDAKGIFHIGGTERISRFELARRMADCFSLPVGLITAITTDQLPRAAARPSWAGLDCRETERFLQTTMPRLADDLARLKREMST